MIDEFSLKKHLPPNTQNPLNVFIEIMFLYFVNFVSFVDF